MDAMSVPACAPPSEVLVICHLSLQRWTWDCVPVARRYATEEAAWQALVAEYPQAAKPHHVVFTWPLDARSWTFCVVPLARPVYPTRQDAADAARREGLGHERADEAH